MAVTLAFSSLPLFLVTKALADVAPTAPGPGQTFNAGSICTVEWDADQSGTWKNVTIGMFPALHKMSLLISCRRLDVGLKHEYEPRGERRVRPGWYRFQPHPFQLDLSRSRSIFHYLFLSGTVFLSNQVSYG